MSVPLAVNSAHPPLNESSTHRSAIDATTSFMKFQLIESIFVVRIVVAVQHGRKMKSHRVQEILSGPGFGTSGRG